MLELAVAFGADADHVGHDGAGDGFLVGVLFAHCARGVREILDAAFTAFGRLGYERATLSDVARVIGVSPGTICHHFGTKQELYQAVVADRFFRFHSEMERLLLSHEGTHRELLHKLLQRFWDYLWEPGQLDFMLVSQVEASQFPESGRLQFQSTCCRSRDVLSGALSAGTLWVNLYAASELATSLPGGERVRIRQATDYPWDGNVRLTVDEAPAGPLKLKLRIPAWTDAATVRLAGEAVERPAEPATYFEIGSSSDTLP